MILLSFYPPQFVIGHSLSLLIARVPMVMFVFFEVAPTFLTQAFYALDIDWKFLLSLLCFFSSEFVIGHYSFMKTCNFKKGQRTIQRNRILEDVISK